MSGYLVAAFALLAVMVYLILRPFLVPATVTSGVPLVIDAEASTDVPAPAPAAVDVARRAGEEPGSDVRATVEAAIAARKAAMSGRHCTGCGGVLDGSDAFCRACGAAAPAPSAP